MFPSKTPEKSQKSTCYSSETFFLGHVMDFVLNTIILPEISRGSRICELFSSQLNSLGAIGLLPVFSNCLKVKSELCSPQSFYKFKYTLCKEEVGFF